MNLIANEDFQVADERSVAETGYYCKNCSRTPFAHFYLLVEHRIVQSKIITKQPEKCNNMDRT